MKKLCFSTFILLCATILNAQIKVACIGNSITYGMGVDNREVNNYPVQLQNMLGNKYEVKNYGISARTLLRKGDHPYWDEQMYKESLDFQPNIVIIKLGTNDSKPINWKYKSEFEKDYKDFIHSYAQLASHPKIYVCKPVPIFAGGGGVWADSTIVKHIIPMLERIAKDEKVEIIDLYAPFKGKGNLVPDGIHPNAEGAKIIAGTVFNVITKKADDKRNRGIKSEWKGFERYDFYFNGRNARIVLPKNKKAKTPWVWNARFPDWHPEMDSILVSEGFCVTNLNTDELLGSPSCVEIWKEYHDFLTTEFNLNSRFTLEGISRGGLYVYNFAAKYPQLINCIYTEGPVCDIKSWPGGKKMKGNSGREDEWVLIKKHYGFKDDAEAYAYKKNPIDNLENIAKAKIPIIAYINRNDSIVPSAENTLLLAERYKKLGGNITIVYCTKEVPGTSGHHYAIETPREAANFVIKHSIINKFGYKDYHLYRGTLNNSKVIFEKKKFGRVAFLGGSITYNGGWRDSICDYLKRNFPNTKFEFINAGIPSTGSVPGAFRYKHDVLAKGKVDLLFEEAAVNDGPAGNNMTPTMMTRGMEGIIRQALETNPEIDIVMMHFADPDNISVYNSGKTPTVIEKFDAVASNYNIPTINIAKEVTDRINNHEFSWEYDIIDLHPSPFGQGIYAQSMIDFLDNAWKHKSDSKIKKHTLNPKKIDQFSYSNGDYINIKEAKLISGFKYVEKWKPTDVGGREGFENVPVLEATESGAELQIDFTGTAAGIFVAAGPDAGIVETSIDGKTFNKIDLFTSWSSGLHLPWVYVLQDNLQRGKHTLTIKISKDRNTLSKGNACRIVYFVVNK